MIFLWLFCSHPNSKLLYILGAIHNIVNIDCKKRSDAESVSFDFRIKKISAYGVDNDILEEIKKFPFPFQQLIIKEACAVMNRLEKGKGVPGLTSLDCYCLFRHRYLLQIIVKASATVSASSLLTKKWAPTFQHP